MLNSTSIKTRFLVSIGSNTLRSLISFFSGLFVARGLNPSGYGDMAFLLGSFLAIKSLLDMGTSTAFFTFLSQRQRGRRFFYVYFLWLGLQFVITALLVAIVLPQTLVERVWLGHSRTIVLLAFVASFMQQQVWITISQIGESSRKTMSVQLISQAIAFIHLIFILVFIAYDWLSVANVLWLIIAEYLLAITWAYWSLRDRQRPEKSPFPEDARLRKLLADYWSYCKPLILLSIIRFLYDFADRWLLQKFSGADQQGFYQVAMQFSSISLIATSSILNVFWKEIAEAHDRNDRDRVAAIYHRVNRGLVMFGAIVSGLLIPWTDQIVSVFLGQAYAMAAPVLLVMFFYPIHQSMGQIGGTMLLASGQTRTYMTISIVVMLISLPLTYLVLAPVSGPYISGLGGGALGMAIKVVVLNVFSVNALAWLIARDRSWKFDWFYQVIGIGAAVVFGYLAKLLVGMLWHKPATDVWHLLLPFLTTGVIYSTAIILLVFSIPWLIGMKRIELRALVDEYLFFRK